MDINRRWALEMNKEKTGYLSDIKKTQVFTKPRNSFINISISYM
jgi:hypothetical protein